MYSDFEEANLYVYHSLCGMMCDVIIWCLGPLVDDSRDYNLARCYLALATRRICRFWIAPTD